MGRSIQEARSGDDEGVGRTSLSWSIDIRSKWLGPIISRRRWDVRDFAVQSVFASNGDDAVGGSDDRLQELQVMRWPLAVPMLLRDL